MPAKMTLGNTLVNRLSSVVNFFRSLSTNDSNDKNLKSSNKSLAEDVEEQQRRSKTLIPSIFKIISWSKARVIYYVNNWVYTTNHKRIAVNYFWFVILSGVCGMALATIIRLEMAYPGVGILAGDSLQYLSIVTAHAVIMVFFMIMPLLFGAFGNFLLPTQLGVHDVAFPRLNSAAFWFLPAGLIMLCQLVCLDRRYQRMNCFNIREVQAILKARFFTDLVSAHDSRLFLNKTVIGLRFKIDSLDVAQPNMLLFYRYGVYNTSSPRKQYFNTIIVDNNKVFINSESYLYFLIGRYTNISDIITIRYFFTGYYGLISIFLANEWRVVVPNKKGRHTIGSLSDIQYFYWSGEFGRQFHAWSEAINFDKPHWLSARYFQAWYCQFLDRLMLGLMDDNMGIHKARKMYRPHADHPTVITDGYLIELWLSAAHMGLSRTLFNIFRGCEAIGTLLYSEGLTLAKNVWEFLKNFSLWGFLTFDRDSVTVASSGNIANFFKSGFIVILESLRCFLDSLLYSVIIFLNVFINPNTLNNYIDTIIDKVELTSSLPVFCGLGDLEFAVCEDFLFDYSNYIMPYLESKALNNLSLEYSTKLFTSTDLLVGQTHGSEEISSTPRHLRFNSPIFRYDFKKGNYITDRDKGLFSYLFTTLSEVTGGVRRSAWFFSDSFIEIFEKSFPAYKEIYMSNINETTNKNNVDPAPTNNFYNFFYILSDSQNLINRRWVAVSAMDQKFYKMFTTSSMQQRIYSNWRQLKFTREAWRCKLLAARHQKTLYRRYVDEDSLLWALERNAKDVLPGWAMITPFSARTRFTAIGKVDIGLMGVFLVLNSSIVSSANFLVTYRYLSTLNNRKMRDARAFFTEGVMVASWMMIAANPMLAIGILMLLSDRHWQTSFFDYSGGGDTVLFQHMFWFFGHPEVYVIMIPAFGFNNTILSYYLRKRVSARASLLYSMYTIAFLGFFVWGHHMYMVGLAHTTRMLFSTLTVMISVPAATKLMHWCVTLANSAFIVELPFVFTLLFIFFFVSGGISGMAVAHTGMDVLFHDSFYVIGHFHVMLAGAAMFASFGAFYFYFPAIFGVKYSRIYGYLHCTYYLIGQLMTVMPMFWLGYSGMPRRILDYPAALGGWHAIVSAGHLLSVAGLMSFFIMIFDSLRQSRAVTRNSFGITRFNTRLNFYLYEIARTKHLQRKGWHISRFGRFTTIKEYLVRYKNHEVLETTLYSYSFKQL